MELKDLFLRINRIMLIWLKCSSVYHQTLKVALIVRVCSAAHWNSIFFKTPDKTIQTKFTPPKSAHIKSPQTKSFPDPQSFLNSKPKKTPRVLDFEVDTTHSELVDAKCIFREQLSKVKGQKESQVTKGASSSQTSRKSFAKQIHVWGFSMVVLSGQNKY